ncbi:MAG: tyrosine-type recombinase/integrase [Elusimicrobia bacterium]|nr:tyrosine-type recombinase/integrase [Elusimicrobiota bacterium]
MSDDLSRHLKDFLQSYLRQQRDFSPHTIKSYRDAFKLLLRYALSRRPGLKKAAIRDLDAKTILSFLQNLEDSQLGRGNNIRTRNQRLAAIHAFFKYLSLHVPSVEPQARRILAIPFKKTTSKPADSLTHKELEVLLAQPQASGADGFRDLTILVFLYNSGARAQEVADLRLSSFNFANNTVKIIGKGKNERLLPLQLSTIKLLKLYKEKYRRQSAGEHFFINQRNGRFTRFGIRTIVKKYLQLAGRVCPTLAAKRLSTHSLRHTCASHMRDSDVEFNLIRGWLGHKSLETTTSIYTHVDLSPQRRIYEKFGPPNYVVSAVESICREPQGQGFDWLDDL